MEAKDVKINEAYWYVRRYWDKQDTPIESVERVLVLDVKKNVLIKREFEKPTWVKPSTSLYELDNLPECAEDFVGVSDEEFLANCDMDMRKEYEELLESRALPKRGLAELVNDVKPFPKAKWGFVNIPEYHHSTEVAIARIIGYRGGVPSQLEGIFGGYFSGVYKFTDEMFDLWALSKRVDGLLSASELTFLITQFSIIHCTNGCKDKGSVVRWEDYYQTDYWKRVREVMISHYTDNCCLCGSDITLQVHHKTYERVGCELASDLSVLCASCHSAWHKAKNGGDLTEKVRSFLTAFKALENSL